MKLTILKTITVLLAAATICTAAPGTTRAADMLTDTSASDPWAGTTLLIRARAIGMVPDVSDGRLGGAPAGLHVNNALMPELDFSYFFTENIAVEMILAATKHKVSLSGTGKVSELWVLPPTVTVQYHHHMGALKPYVGLGVNYTMILSSKGTAAIGGVDSWKDAFGFAVQFGFDMALDDRWSFNVDVKKLWLNFKANVTPAGTSASVDLDPWVFGLGLGYRF